MFHVFIAFIIMNQQVKIFESVDEFPTEQACKESIPDHEKKAEKMLKDQGLENAVKIVKSICAQEPKKDDTI